MSRYAQGMDCSDTHHHTSADADWLMNPNLQPGRAPRKPLRFGDNILFIYFRYMIGIRVAAKLPKLNTLPDMLVDMLSSVALFHLALDAYSTPRYGCASFRRQKQKNVSVLVILCQDASLLSFPRDPYRPYNPRTGSSH